MMQFKMAQDYFEPAKGGLIIDVSCGSGLFSRKFAQSGSYSGVVALDFSENMLRQCYDFIKKEDTLSSAYFFPLNLILNLMQLKNCKLYVLLCMKRHRCP